MGLMRNAILGLALSFALAMPAWAEPDDEGQAPGRAAAERSEPGEEQRDGVQATEPAPDIPLYVPPTNRGSIPVRIGGGSRGGKVPGRRI